MRLSLILTILVVGILVLSQGCAISINGPVENLSRNAPALNVGTGGAGTAPDTTPFRAVPAKHKDLLDEQERLKKAILDLQEENRKLQFTEVDVYPAD